MSDYIKELVKRLRGYDGLVQMSPMTTTEVIGSCQAAADALEAMAGEVAGLNIVVTGWMKAFDKQEARAEAAEAERDRLKAVLKPRLNAKAIEGLQEILEAMEAMDEREAPFLKTLLDWHEAARKALGDAS